MKKSELELENAKLERRVTELKAQLSCSFAFAAAELHRAGRATRIGSGVLLQLTAIGGKEIINPVMIKDGLSGDTIAAIRGDLKRSYELSISFSPKDTKVD